MAKSVLDPPATEHFNLLPVSAQRRRRRRLQFGVLAGPSSGVLSLLATISAASSAADGSPLVAQPTPPPFLCPYIARDNHEAYVDIVAETSASAVLSVPGYSIRHRKRVADKFERGPDGKYRRVDRYTLYGSTVCAVSRCFKRSS